MRLSEVPAWFWVSLALLLAAGGAAGGLLRSRLRSGAWRWRYRPEHALSAPVEYDYTPRGPGYGSMILAEERALEVVHEPSAAEVAASRAAHGYIRELDPDADDLGPGAGFLLPGYNSHLPSLVTAQMKVDSPAPDWPAWPTPARLLRTTGELLRADLLVECTTFMARQDAEVAVWLASAGERWAAA